MGDYSPSAGRVGFNTGGAVAGIAALANQVLGDNCGDGGLLNWGNNKNCHVTEKEFAWAQVANAESAKVAKLESEKYTDSVGLDLYKNIIAETTKVDDKQSANIATINAELVRLREESAVLKADLRCLNVTNQHEHAALKNSFESALQLESERRACGDENLLTYVNSNFIKGTLKLPADDICPEVQLKCPDVQLVQLISSAVAQAVASI